MPPSTEIISFINSANMPQLGSLGEAIYEVWMTKIGAIVSRLHTGRADFLVDGSRVDVKTSRQQIDNLLERPVFRYRHSIPNTQYAILEFHRLGAVLSVDQQITGRIDWEFIESVFDQWIKGHLGKPHSPKKASRTSLCSEMIEKTNRAFIDACMPEPYILQRTVMFHKESPHNLLPTQRRANKQTGATVFFIFHMAPPVQDNLKEIIAFPDSADSGLVRLKKLRTAGHIENLEKADIEMIPCKYRFPSIEALREALMGNWKSR